MSLCVGWSSGVGILEIRAHAKGSIASMGLIFVLPWWGFSWCYPLPRALSYTESTSKFLSFCSNGCNLIWMSVPGFLKRSNAKIEDQADVRREAWNNKKGIYNHSHSTTCQGKNVPLVITCRQVIKNGIRKKYQRLTNGSQHLIKV
jgi:hypothetical protein